MAEESGLGDRNRGRGGDRIGVDGGSEGPESFVDVAGGILVAAKTKVVV